MTTLKTWVRFLTFFRGVSQPLVIMVTSTLTRFIWKYCQQFSVIKKGSFFWRGGGQKKMGVRYQRGNCLESLRLRCVNAKTQLYKNCRQVWISPFKSFFLIWLLIMFFLRGRGLTELILESLNSPMRKIPWQVWIYHSIQPNKSWYDIFVSIFFATFFGSRNVGRGPFVVTKSALHFQP